MPSPSGNDPFRHQHGPAHGGSPRSSPAALATSAAEAADRTTDRLAALSHELANLIDATLRCVVLARAGIRTGPALEPFELADRQLQAAASGLERMGELIHAAMQPGAGWLAHIHAPGHTLREAIEHAAEVLRPLATERAVAIETQFGAHLGDTPAGPLYSVVCNGLRNAIDASPRGGRILVRADVAPSVGARGELWIDILDEGPGPSDDVQRRAFDPGFTTKRNGMGYGLALCRDIVRQIGGLIDLTARADEDGAGPGACLRVRCPPPARPL